MEVQSNNIAASLFDGLAQSQQTQGTTTNNDLFSKMMDRMLADAAARKREQAADAARDTAKDAAKDAREARDAQAAESRRRQPVRAEPKPDLNRDRSPLPSRPADAARAPEPKAARTDDGDRNVRAGHDDRQPAKTEKPKEPSKTDGAGADGAKAGAAKTAAAKTDGSGTADADTAAASSDDAAAASAEDAGTASAETAGGGDRTVEDAGAQDQAAAQPADQPLPVAQPLPPQPLPQSSDLILAGLMPVGQATKDAADMAGGGGDAAASSGAAGNGVAGVLDPATQLAQAQAAAAGPVAGGPAGASVTAGEAAKPAGKPGDAAQAADTAQADAGTEALPTDEDAALPDRFADLLAAAKAKTGEAKANGKHAGTEGGNRNDAQPQAPALPQQPIPLAAPAAKAAEAIATAAAGGAAKTLESVEGVGGAGASGTAAASPHLHPALAAMENIHSSLPGIDQPQAAATLRPSRGAGMPMGVHDQIAVHIKKNVGDEVDQFTINLHPAELGRIDIKLDIAADGRVNAMVAVEKAQTLELLQRDSRSLERALQDAGLQTDSNSLNFSLRGEGNPFAGDGRGDGKGNGSGRRGRGFGGDGDDDAADGAVYTATLGNGRVDIRA